MSKVDATTGAGDEARTRGNHVHRRFVRTTYRSADEKSTRMERVWCSSSRSSFERYAVVFPISALMSLLRWCSVKLLVQVNHWLLAHTYRTGGAGTASIEIYNQNHHA